MSCKDLVNDMSNFIKRNEYNILSNSEFSIRDKAFYCYYLIKNGEPNKILTFISSTVQLVNFSNAQYGDIVYWLWILSEYVNKTGEEEKVNEYLDIVNECVERIENRWDKDNNNWLEPSNTGIFSVNIAMTYRAIYLINKFFAQKRLEKFLIVIKTYFFDYFIRNFRYISENKHKDILGDISALAVPFGFVEVDDIFFEKSINYIEKVLIAEGTLFFNDDTFKRIELYCLLSWYYSERGDILYAKQVLEQVENIWDEKNYIFNMDLQSYNNTYCLRARENSKDVKNNILSFVLYMFARNSITNNSKMGVCSLNRTKIIHNPTGYDDPYNFTNIERHPRYPEENDNVFIKVSTNPFNVLQKIYVEYSVNGNIKPALLMQLKTTHDKDKFWQGCIGKFKFGDEIEYRFRLEFNGETTVSEKYTYSIRKWCSISNVEHLIRNHKHIECYSKPLDNLKRMPYIRIEKHTNNICKFIFELKQYPIKLYENNKMSEEENIELDNVKLKCKKDAFCFNIVNIDEKVILKSYNENNITFLEILTDKSGNIYKIRYNFKLFEDERIFGTGERFSSFELKGLDIDNYVYNQYLNQKLRTYLPIPFYLSTKRYGIYFDTSLYIRYRFGTSIFDLNQVEINLSKENQSSSFYIFVGEPKEIIQGFINISGKPKLPPKWSFGLWISSNSWNSQSKIYKQIEYTNKYRIPTTVIVLEQWSDEATYYIFKDAEYSVKPGDQFLKYNDFKFSHSGAWPNPKEMVEYLHQQGIRVLLWQVPFLKYMGDIRHLQRDEDEKVMLHNNYHIKYKDGKEYRNPYPWFEYSLSLDFTNPKARKWWLNKRCYLVEEMGIDGFKTDGGEYILGNDLNFFNGKNEEEMRNEYPNEYVSAYYNFMQQRVKDGGIMFSRSGYTGAQQFPLHWAGDEKSTFEGFRASVNAGLSSGISGIPFWGWDLGGFSGEIPTDELYLRSTQMATFCPVMQYHAEAAGEKNLDRTPWNIAERTNKPYVIEIFKKYVDLRMNILPYIYLQAIISSRIGVPMMRMMFLEYPDDSNCIKTTQQYMFGDNMLVAPVIDEGEYYKYVYFPCGNWMEFFTGHILNGSKFIRITVDIDHIPVYIKEDSIIPLNLANDYQLFGHVGNKLDEYTNFCLMFFISNSIEYRFMDDLGNNILIKSKRFDNEIEINFESNYDKPIVLIFKAVLQVTYVRLDDKVIEKVDNVKTLNSNKYKIDKDMLIIKVMSVKEKFRISIKGELNY